MTDNDWQFLATVLCAVLFAVGIPAGSFAIRDWFTLRRLRRGMRRDVARRDALDAAGPNAHG